MRLWLKILTKKSKIPQGYWNQISKKNQRKIISQIQSEKVENKITQYGNDGFYFYIRIPENQVIRISNDDDGKIEISFSNFFTFYLVFVRNGNKNVKSRNVTLRGIYLLVCGESLTISDRLKYRPPRLLRFLQYSLLLHNYLVIITLIFHAKQSQFCYNYLIWILRLEKKVENFIFFWLNFQVQIFSTPFRYIAAETFTWPKLAASNVNLKKIKGIWEFTLINLTIHFEKYFF